MDEPEGQKPRTEAEWAADRARLQARLDKAKSEQGIGVGGPEPTRGMQGMAQGFKIASEFIAGIVVGGAIGYGFDRLFGTLPFGLIVFLMFGFAAGVLNVVRSTNKTAQNPPDPR